MDNEAGKTECEIVIKARLELETALDICNELCGEINIREFNLMRTKLQEAKMWFDKGVVEKL